MHMSPPCIGTGVIKTMFGVGWYVIIILQIIGNHDPVMVHTCIFSPFSDQKSPYSLMEPRVCYKHQNFTIKCLLRKQKNVLQFLLISAHHPTKSNLVSRHNYPLPVHHGVCCSLTLWNSVVKLAKM